MKDVGRHRVNMKITWKVKVYYIEIYEKESGYGYIILILFRKLKPIKTIGHKKDD